MQSLVAFGPFRGCKHVRVVAMEEVSHARHDY